NYYYYGKDAGLLMSGWDYLFALLAVSAVIIALAFLLYKKRHLESAGDVISHSFLRPVFKYCFTFGCAVVLGSFFYYFIWNTNNATSAIAYIVSLLIGGFIGYFAAEMMLKKRFRVFVAGYKGFLASSAVIMAICGMFYFDLFGVAGNVPTADKIAEMHVQVSTANGSQFFTYTLDDETQPLTVVEMQAVEDWLAVHELLISEKDIVNEFQQMLNEGAYPTVDYDPYPIYDKSKTIEELVLVPADELNLDHYRMRGISFNYYLKNGSQISRYYRIPVSELILADSSSSAWQVQTLINRGELLKYRNLDWLEADPDDITLMYLIHNKDEVKIYGPDALLLLEAVQKDIEQGKIGKVYISNTAEYYRESTILWLRMEYEEIVTDYEGESARWKKSVEIDITTQSENTIRALQQLGLLGSYEKTPSSTESETNSKTIIGYIKELHNEKVSFDEIEWVIVPSKRAKELEITDDDAPNGFYIHNEETVIKEYGIADKCMICILDWENNFTTKQIELVNFFDILEQRGNAPIPYMLTIEDGNVINIEEHYIP
ncbi:MAG: hypothetical protein IJP33_02775, partial [Firmicutes bacterium]|nr:hypothetical protein [Bacillota bacterium]